VLLFLFLRASFDFFSFLDYFTKLQFLEVFSCFSPGSFFFWTEGRR